MKGFVLVSLIVALLGGGNIFLQDSVGNLIDVVIGLEPDFVRFNLDDGSSVMCGTVYLAGGTNQGLVYSYVEYSDPVSGDIVSLSTTVTVSSCTGFLESYSGEIVTADLLLANGSEVGFFPEELAMLFLRPEVDSIEISPTVGA